MRNPKVTTDLWIFFIITLTITVASCARNNLVVVKPTVTPSSMNSPSPSASVETFHGTGTVVSTNPKFPSVELDHQEIIGLMPAMTMEFYVKDVSMLTGLKRGDKVEFTIENGVGGIKITEIHKL